MYKSFEYVEFIPGIGRKIKRADFRFPARSRQEAETMARGLFRVWSNGDRRRAALGSGHKQINYALHKLV